MKKVLIIFLVLFFFPLLTAVEIDMKDNFNQGETLTAKISGNFFEPVSKDNVAFYRGHVRTSIVPFVTEINNDFYIYAQLIDKSPNNYSIAIENAKYFQGSQIIEENIVKNFSINENIADFSVDKGFVITEGDFFIEVKNLQDHEITINLGETDYGEGFFASLFGGQGITESVTLSPGETKKINFEISENQSELKTIELSTENLKYKILVYVFLSEEQEKEKNFRFEPSLLNVSMATDASTIRILYLRNIGETEIENISLKISDSLISHVALLTEKIDSLDIGSRKKIELSIFSGAEEKSIEGQITAVALNGELQTYASVFLNFLKDYIPSDEEDTEIQAQTCSELNGVICDQNQKCSDENVEYTSEGVCCLGTCKDIEKSSTGKIIGWIIIFAIIIFATWFYLKKYKKVEKITDLMKVLRR